MVFPDSYLTEPVEAYDEASDEVLVYACENDADWAALTGDDTHTHTRPATPSDRGLLPRLGAA